MLTIQPKNTKHMTITDPRAIRALNFIQQKSPVTLHTIDDMHQEVKNTVTEYYSEVYAQALVENNGNEPKNVKITIGEYAILLKYVLPLAIIAPQSKLKATTAVTEPTLYMYDFDENSSTYGLYIQDYQLLVNIIYYSCPHETASFRQQIYNAIVQSTQCVHETSDVNHIPVKNGIFNKKTKELEPFSPDHYYLAKIQTDYNPQATSPVITMPDGLTWSFDSWLDELVDHDPVRLEQMWQVITAALNPGRFYNKCVIFYSQDGNNGKGTLGQVLKNIIGESLYSSVNIKNFGVRFRTQQLLGKILNIADENPVGANIDEVDEFKAAITGDDIQIEAKGKDAYPMQVRMLNIQMMNGALFTKDKSNSIYRRLLIIPFTHCFTGVERPYIKRDYMNRTEVKEYILKRALEAPIVTEFITTKENEDALYQTKIENNTVYEFLDEMLPCFNWDVLPTKFLYDLYKAWMAKYNQYGKAVKKSTFIEYAVTFFKQNDEWSIHTSQNDKIKINGRMDADEPLISEYNLTDYFDLNYKGTSRKLQRAFPRPKTTRGFVKTKKTKKK